MKNTIIMLLVVYTLSIQAVLLENEQMLLQAARGGQQEKVKELLGKKVNPNVVDDYGAQPITVALQRPLRLDLDPQNSDYKTAVSSAVAIVKDLLAAGSLPTEQNFIDAIKLGSVDLVKAMQPSVNGINIIKNNPSALVAAFNSGAHATSMVDYLIEQGASVNAQADGASVLSRAISVYYQPNGWALPLESIEALLKKGALIDDHAAIVAEGSNRNPAPTNDKKEALGALLKKYKKQ